MKRMTEGKETWHRLLEWDRGQTPAERLSAILLHNDGFKNVDPSHPLGGKDGLKDLSLSFQGVKWIGAVFFPRGQKRFNEIQAKFESDLEGAIKDKAKGFAFITNQELRLAERRKLIGTNKIDIKIYHLEMIASLLNCPKNFGTRMDFLDIEMTKEEQLSFFDTQNERINRIENALYELSSKGQESYKKFEQSFLFQNENEERSLDEVLEAIEEFSNKIWFDRHLTLRYKVENEKDKVDPEIWKGALKSAQRVIAKYGEQNLGPYSDFEWGMINGKLSALRWVIGEDWDMLDT